MPSPSKWRIWRHHSNTPASRGRVRLRISDGGIQRILLLWTFLLFYPSESLRSETGPAAQWHDVYTQIRDGLISRQEALFRVKSLEAMVKEFYLQPSYRGMEEPLCFPLEGYDSRAIGGKGGSGYQARGYDFFDGNRHKGHPGHDLFIRDNDQDGLDDATGKPVSVLSASSGIVVSVHLGWTPSSPIRGGTSVWIYEPIKGRYYYYAHLQEVFIKIGQKVDRGERIGTVGRTGKNAYPRRSPTHLHLTVLQSMEGYPKPINPYPDLKRGNNRE
jgi:peptidoglycan LD-endopeptidase LytH